MPKIMSPKKEGSEPDMNTLKALNDQNINRVFKEVTVPQLHKMCEWYEEDEGKKTDWMSMLISVVAATFETMYTNRGGMFDEKKES